MWMFTIHAMSLCYGLCCGNNINMIVICIIMRGNIIPFNYIYIANKLITILIVLVYQNSLYR